MIKLSIMDKFDDGVRILFIDRCARTFGFWYIYDKGNSPSGFHDDELDFTSCRMRMKWLDIGPFQIGITEIIDGIRPEQPDF